MIALLLVGAAWAGFSPASDGVGTPASEIGDAAAASPAGASQSSSGMARGTGSYVLPEPPAQVLIGGQAKLDEPSTPADFAVSAGNFFTSEGELRAGGALEVGVRALGLTRRVSHARYQSSPALRVLSRTYVSAATAKAPEGRDLLGAFGVRTVLFDGADPLVSVGYARATAAAEAACDGVRAAGGEGWADAWAACLDAAYAESASGLRPPDWNAFGVVLSGAYAWRFADGALSGLGGQDVSGWASVAGPLGPLAQLGGAVAWTESLGEHPDELGTTALARVGVRRTRFRVELGHVLALPVDPEDTAGHRFPLLMGGEVQLEDEFWLSASFGFVIDPTSDLVTMVSEGSVRWGQASEPSFMAGGVDGDVNE